LKLLAAFLSLFVCFAYADKIKVGADAWADVTETDGSGIYFKLLNEIYGEENIDIHIDSFHRSLKSFDDKKIDLLLGVFREDVKQAIIPKWYINTDDPILVFYRKDIQHKPNIHNLADFSNSWVRGYHFERFINDRSNTYKVNFADEGFKLLANNRIDTFIDYLINVPVALSDKFDHFELLPAKRLYIAFQKNQRGQKLANIFDTNMSLLRQTGKLKKIYAELYEQSALATFEENKEKMVILTDEISLLRGNKQQALPTNQTLNNNLNLLFDQLDAYDFEFKLVDDYANISQNIGQDNLCYSDMLKTTEREKHFIFSKPFALYLGLQIYSKTPLPTNENNQVDVSALLAKHQDKKIGLVSGRSLGEKVDQQLTLLSDKQIIKVPTKLNRTLAIFNHNRFDYLIEYPQYIDLHWPNISNQKLYSYPIEGGKLYSVGHMMCPKTKNNHTFLSRLNQNIQKHINNGTLYNVLTNEVSDDKQAEFTRYFHQVFKPQAIVTE
jgi:polar amino acid transport system substrate-binding protein